MCTHIILGVGVVVAVVVPHEQMRGLRVAREAARRAAGEVPRARLGAAALQVRREPRVAARRRHVQGAPTGQVLLLTKQSCCIVTITTDGLL